VFFGNWEIVQLSSKKTEMAYFCYNFVISVRVCGFALGVGMTFIIGGEYRFVIFLLG
jgi:hypothetical protein